MARPSIPKALAITVLLIAAMIAVQIVLRPLLHSDLVAELAGFLAIYAGLWICLRFWLKRPFRRLGYESSPRGVLHGSWIAAVMIAAIAALTLLAGGHAAPGAGDAAILTLVVTVVQSSAEEALFRGWLMSSLEAGYGLWRGVLLSSLAFMLAHATNGPPPLGWLNLFLFGTTAALLVLTEHGLWAASAWHSLWNWLEGSAVGLPVDRIAHEGIFVTIHPAGPAWLTGDTAFGPDGGLITTAVLVTGIAIILWARHQT